MSSPLHKYNVPFDVGSLKPGAVPAAPPAAGAESRAAGAAGGSGTTAASGKAKRKNTKKNPFAKLHLGDGTDKLYVEEDEGGDFGDDEEMEVPSGDAYGPDSVRSHPPPAVTLNAYKKRATLILRDYLAGGDMEACLSSVHELGSPFFHYELVKRTLTFGIEGGDAERERASRLLSQLYGLEHFSMLQIGTGFERLFESLDDLALDAPGARACAGKFLARAIADEILPPSFLSDQYVIATAGDVIDEARALLSVPHASEKLQLVWHVSGAFDTAAVKASIRETLAEYFSGGDTAEALRCLRELGVPHFMHEAVYRAIVLSLDVWPDTARADSTVALLHKAAGVVTPQQAAIGCQRAANAIADIEKDAPLARVGLASISGAFVAKGVLPASFVLGIGAKEAAPAAAGAGKVPEAAAADT